MRWIIWALFSAFFAGLTAVLAKVGVANVDSNLATAIRTGVVLIFTWLLVILNGGWRDMPGLTSRTWIFLVASGVATGLSWLCYFRALQLGPASRVAPIDKLSVVFAIIFAAALLHERISSLQGVGVLLICAGAILLALQT